MYQQNFPVVHPPVPSPPPPSLVLAPIADPPRKSLLGILARMVLGRFMLGRVPEATAATQATCPYIPFHVPEAGFNFNVHVVDSNSVLTAFQREVKVTPTYAGNVASIAKDQNITLTIPPVASLDARPFRHDFIAGKDDGIPLDQASGTDAAAAREAQAKQSLPSSTAGSAFQFSKEPTPATPSLPQKGAATSDSAPSKPVECR